MSNNSLPEEATTGENMVPGEIIPGDEEVEINKDRQSKTISVSNTGDRPIQIGSHFHFFEVNKKLEFDREEAFGMRLDIPAGTAVRFEPGEEQDVQVVEFGGKKRIKGMNNLTNGSVSRGNAKRRALQRAEKQGFKGIE